MRNIGTVWRGMSRVSNGRAEGVSRLKETIDITRVFLMIGAHRLWRVGTKRSIDRGNIAS